MKVEDVDRWNQTDVRRYLRALIAALDELDTQDYFGTKGWRHFLMGED